MKKYTLPILFLFLSILCLWLCFIFSSKSYKKHYQTKRLEDLQSFFLKSEQKFSDISTALFEKEEITLTDVTQFSNQDYTILYYQNDELKEWSSRQFVPQAQIERELNLSGQKKDKGYFIPIEDKTYFVQSFEAPTNRYLYFIQELEHNKIIQANSFAGTTPIISFYAGDDDSGLTKEIKNLKGDELKVVSIVNPEKSNKLLELSWLFHLIFSCAFIFYFFKLIKKNVLIISNGFLMLFSFLIFKEIFKTDPFQVLNDFDIFKPNLFANPIIGNSLGLLILNYIFIFLSIYYWYRKRARYTILKKVPKSLQIILSGVLIGLTFFTLSYTCRSLVRDSSPVIGFNPYSDWYTLLIFTLFFFAVLYKFLFDLRLVKFIKKNFNKVELTIISLVATIIALIVLSLTFSLRDTLFLITWQVISFVVTYLLLENTEYKIKQISGIVLLFTLFSIFCAQTLKHYSFEKQKGEIRQTAIKLSLENDENSKFDIESLVMGIDGDRIIQSQIQNPFIPINNIKSRIENKYISDQLSQYDIEYDFIEFFDSLNYRSDIMSKSDYENFEYIANIPLEDVKRTLLSVRFKRKKLDFQDNFYTRLNNSTIQSKALPPDLSYAIFENNQLTYLDGNINEPNWEKMEPLKAGESAFFSGSQETKMYYQKNDFTTILISIPKAVKSNGLLFLFTNFFGFIFFSFLVYIFIVSGFKITRFAFFKSSLANQIQYLVIFFLYLAGFIVLYSSFHVNKRQLISTHQKTRTAIQEKLVNDYKIQIEENRDLASFKEYLEINVPGSPYGIHLFNEDGNLVYTNQPTLYDKSIWPRRVDPVVLNSFNQKPLQSIVQKESIEDHDYFGFYKAIRLRDLDVDGVLYLSGLDINQSVKAQRNTIVSSQFNAFSIVLFSLTFISLIISQSLTNILFKLRRRFSQVDLSESNKYIDWENDDEIGELVHEYNVMVKKLDQNAVLLARGERESAWRDVAKQVAHEIKNPLTPMKLSIQHLKRRVNDSADTEFDAAILKTLTSLEEQTNHLSRIADNFSSVSKVELPNFQVLNLVKQIEESVALYTNRDDFTIEFNNLLADDVSPLIKADKTMISRILNNLLKNASQALVPGRKGEIKISLDGNNDQFILLVMDNGKGIDNKNRAKIFTPNFTTKSSGTGIGLMMSKKIIELHKGDISFESVKGSGTVFTIVLPKT